MISRFPFRAVAFAALAVIFLAFAVGLGGCKSARPSDRPTHPQHLPTGQADAAKKPLQIFPGTHYQQLAKQNSESPTRADFAPTPGGERRYVRALKAARPAYTAKRGAVLTVAAAGADVRVNAATGKRAAAASDSAALVVAAKGAQAALATNGSTIQQTPPARVGWLAGLKAWLVPSLAAAGLAWLVFFVWRRRRNYPA